MKQQGCTQVSSTASTARAGMLEGRDVTLDEDRSRIRTNPGIFARLRSFAANILRFNQKRSISQDRYANALGGISHIARLACK